MPDPVQRWDVYDIADELADMAPLVRMGVDDPRVLPEVIHLLEQLEARLWRASRRGGVVGPFPTYRTIPECSVTVTKHQEVWDT